jgi:nucleoside-diphosphate-sugar epimerase
MVGAKPNRVFLTGGTGFIGAHAARHLLDIGRSVVILTRDPSRVPRSLERRAEIVQGSLRDEGMLAHELGGCDAVVHCAKSDDPDPERRAEKELTRTRHLLDSALTARVQRFVYLSSIASYGPTPDGVVDETFPRLSPTDLYGRTKFRLEQEVLARGEAMEVVVLQPANVYGAGRCWWGQGMLDLMRIGKVIMVDNGEGIANMVHVTDVVQAIENALDMPAIAGECFLITDGMPIRWYEYYHALEYILGHNATLTVPAATARSLSRKLRNRSLAARGLRWLNRTLLKRPVIFPVSDDAIDNFCRKSIFSIAKARQRLGYNPQYNFAAGLETIAADSDRARSIFSRSQPGALASAPGRTTSSR